MTIHDENENRQYKITDIIDLEAIYFKGSYLNTAVGYFPLEQDYYSDKVATEFYHITFVSFTYKPARVISIIF